MEQATITITLHKDELQAIELALTAFREGYVETEFDTSGLQRIHDEAVRAFRFANTVTITRDNEADNDFTVNGLVEDTSVWLTIDPFSVYIKRNDIGISIDVYPKSDEMAEPLSSLVAYDDDVEAGAE